MGAVLQAVAVVEEGCDEQQQRQPAEEAVAPEGLDLGLALQQFDVLLLLLRAILRLKLGDHALAVAAEERVVDGFEALVGDQRFRVVSHRLVDAGEVLVAVAEVEPVGFRGQCDEPAAGGQRVVVKAEFDLGARNGAERQAHIRMGHKDFFPEVEGAQFERERLLVVAHGGVDLAEFLEGSRHIVGIVQFLPERERAEVEGERLVVAAQRTQRGACQVQRHGQRVFAFVARMLGVEFFPEGQMAAFDGERLLVGAEAAVRLTEPPVHRTDPLERLRDAFFVAECFR